MAPEPAGGRSERGSGSGGGASAALGCRSKRPPRSKRVRRAARRCSVKHASGLTCLPVATATAAQWAAAGPRERCRHLWLAPACSRALRARLLCAVAAAPFAAAAVRGTGTGLQQLAVVLGACPCCQLGLVKAQLSCGGGANRSAARARGPLCAHCQPAALSASALLFRLCRYASRICCHLELSR